jgi:hypothetical protein
MSRETYVGTAALACPERSRRGCLAERSEALRLLCFYAAAPLGVWNLLQLRIEMHTAPARDFQLPLPILESRSLPEIVTAYAQALAAADRRSAAGDFRQWAENAKGEKPREMDLAPVPL